MATIQPTSVIHLLHRAGQRADELFAENIGKSQLSPRQFAIMQAIAQAEGEPSQIALVMTTGVDRSTLADIVRRLVERGMLSRKRTKEDARAYALKLTSIGQAALRAAEPAAQKTDEELLIMLSNADRDRMIKSLEKIVAAMIERPAKGERKSRI